MLFFPVVMTTFSPCQMKLQRTALHWQPLRIKLGLIIGWLGSLSILMDGRQSAIQVSPSKSFEKEGKNETCSHLPALYAVLHQSGMSALLALMFYSPTA